MSRSKRRQVVGREVATGESCPHARASTCISSTVAREEAVEPLARPRRPGSRARRCGFWVAMPTGQLLVWHARMPRQPIAWIAELATATASAPSASALAKSGARAQAAGDDERDVARARAGPGGARARASAGIVGTRDVVAEDQSARRRCRRRGRRGSRSRRRPSSAASRSSSMCWADSLKPIGMPPDALAHARRRSARTSSTRVQSGKRGGEIAGVPSGRPRTSAIRPTTLSPGRWPPVPVLAPWPPLKWNACTFVEHVDVPAEPGRRQLVEVAAVLGLLLGQHAALAGADAGARELGAAGRARSSPPATARRSSCPTRTAGCRATAAWRRSGRCTPRCRPARRRAAGGGRAAR